MASTKVVIKKDIRQAIKDKNLTVTEVGRRLFPEKVYAYMAMNRVLNKKQLLNSFQVSELSKILDIPVEELC